MAESRTDPPAGPATPALYPCTVAHIRRAPRRYAFRVRTYLWLIDPDQPPVLPWWLRPLARFDARDHFGGNLPTIRAGLDAFLAARGIDLAGGAVTMLAHARVFGHVFNPLTLYWCHRPDGSTACVVAEVHNTYGERHCYLLHTDDSGRAMVGKDFYVSPFFPVDGDYTMLVPEPDGRLCLTVHLDRPGGRAFTATVRGEPIPAGRRELLLAALRHPWSTAAVSIGIRLHGTALRVLRGLPVQPRPRPPHQKGME
ncbi:DUF1365 domain-containing protein [Streptomyces sp. 8L]|uniref:DUF1365 domain-containing protein n=1 Tax=Streptomyces sp. 8L TaxID=2877242 RepID=UPI001CD1D0D7|nr:DUF1365 domain-containing protein [Streptomyces sp. 8L]MCA1221172.1 DUF1365 domain-containing protein [Streptomyces sp. 8L]